MKKRLILLLIATTTFLTSCNLLNTEENADAPIGTEAPFEGNIFEDDNKDSEDDSSLKEAPQTLNKDTLTVSMRAPIIMNPLLNQDVTVDNVLKLLYENVFTLDENEKPIPNLAESISFSESGLSATVVLRSNIYWSDGEAVDANDLIYSINTIKNADPLVIYKSVVSDIVQCTKIDNYTVKLTLSKPSGGFAYMLLFPLAPSHYYDGISDTNNRNLMPVGNGAYKYLSTPTVNNIKLIANDSYFKGPVNIQNIDVLITSDNQTDYYAFEQNIIDLVSADILDFGKYNPAEKIEAAEYGTNYYDFIGFNFKNIIFEDRRVRQAIAHLVDKDYIIKSIYLEHAYKATSAISPSSWAYEPDVYDYEYSMDMANNLFALAGYKDVNGDGILDRKVGDLNVNLSIKILVNEDNAERVSIAKLLKRSLEDIGIVAEIVSCDYDTYYNKLLDREFDLFIGGYNFTVEPNVSFAFHSSQIGVGSNYFSYNSEVLDSFLQDAENSTTEETYKANLSSVQKHIANELPCISIAFRKKALLYNSKIKGDKQPLITNIYNNMNTWYIE